MNQPYVLDDGTGAPLVLLHGYGLSSASWDPVVARFPAGVRAIRPDARGLGRSAALPGPHDVEQMVDDLSALLRARGIARATIAGHSMGGAVAVAFARRAPERVAALALIDSRVDPDSPAQERKRLELAERARVEGMVAIEAAYLPKFFAPSTYAHRPELVERARTMLAANEPGAAAAVFRGSVRRVDGVAVLASIDVPVLVACGEHDAFFDLASQRRLAAAAKDAALAIVPGAGHLAIWEDPDTIAAALLALMRRAD